MRQSLETVEKCRAELICRRVELEVELRRPTVASQRIPEKLGAALGLNKMPEYPTPAADVPQAPEQPPSPDIKEVLGEFLAHILIENSPAHANNKIACLRKFFGSRLLGLDGDVKGVFCGTTLADVKVATHRVAARRQDDEKAPPGGVPRPLRIRHEIRLFHRREFPLPQPDVGPADLARKKPAHRISQEGGSGPPAGGARPTPPVQIAAAIMIFAGLRCAEALWLTRNSVDPSLRFLSIVNKMDEEKDLESSLKTGERAVQIASRLKALLEPCLSWAFIR